MSDAPAPRRAQARDAEEVDRLYAQLVSNPGIDVLPQRLAELQRSTEAALFVVDDESDDGTGLLGTVFVALCPDAMFGRQPFAVVENIVVDARARGQGIGALLMAEVERFCLAADCSKIFTASENRPSYSARSPRPAAANDAPKAPIVDIFSYDSAASGSRPWPTRLRGSACSAPALGCGIDRTSFSAVAKSPP